MKKNICLICIALLFVTTFYSCEKDPSDNGNLNITVQFNNQPVAGAKVYLKMGVYTHPNFSDSQYDGILTADGNGEVIFSNLTPGRYYLKAMGSLGAITAQGDTIATVVRRYRGDNSSNFTIEIQ